jgi:hypothetical protein
MCVCEQQWEMFGAPLFWLRFTSVLKGVSVTYLCIMNILYY